MGLTPEKGAPQSEAHSPLFSEPFFITQRLLSDDSVRIEELAYATGTSVQMIMDIYYELDIKKRYDSLTHGGYSEDDGEPLIIDGYYAGTSKGAMDNFIYHFIKAHFTIGS